MTNVFDRKLEDKPENEVRTIHSSDLLPGLVKQRNLEANGVIIFIGLAADRPDGSTSTKAFFARDTGVLSLWSDSGWVSVTLS